MHMRSGMILLAALAMPLLHGDLRPAWGQTTASVKPVAAATPSACDRHAFRMVIDVGHTAKVPGATSARGIYEYEFNLRLSKQIAKELVAAGFDRTVLLITPESPNLGLYKRASRADAMAADLFLAIHHDSVPDRMLERWSYEGQDHTYNDRFPGHSIFISNDNPFRGKSLEFAMMLGAQLKSRGLKYTPHYTEHFMGSRRRQLVDADTGVYRYDQLIVLRTTKMPAVLLEAGSIINRHDELELAKPERVAIVADAVVGAAESYCESRGHAVAGAAPPRPPLVQKASARAAKPTAAASMSGARH